MEGLIMAAQLILGLSILVGLHELGHLLAAKAFGMRVEKYYIGFPPKIFGFKYGETEYALGALPLGGFVKISGMVDESLDTENLNATPEPWEFRAKPAWQRLIVMLGGVIVNVITGIIIFICFVYFNGETYYSAKEINKYGVGVSEVGKELGLQQNDKIIKVNGKTISRFEEVFDMAALMESGSYYTVLRDEKEVEIKIPSDFVERLAERNQKKSFVEPLVPFRVGEIEKGSPADKAGLQKGDSVTEAGGIVVKYLQEFQAVLYENRNKTLAIKLLRDGKEVAADVAVREDGKIGFAVDNRLAVEREQYSLIESIPRGTKNAFNIVAVNVMAFGKMFKGELSPSKSLSGPIGIAQIFGGTWDWARFWHITGMLSMVLAFMNLLPIPALDGGHVLFLTYEIVSGRTPSDKFLEISQKIGMAILLVLMVFAFGNDIYKLIEQYL